MVSEINTKNKIEIVRTFLGQLKLLICVDAILVNIGNLAYTTE